VLPELIRAADAPVPGRGITLIAADPQAAGATWASRMQPTVAALAPGAALTPLAGLGHLAPLSAPAAVAAVLRDVVCRVSPGLAS